MARYKELGPDFNRNYRNDLNDNFKKMEHEEKRLQSEFDGAVETVSNRAFNKVVDSAKIDWLEPVATFNDLSATYPNAIEGRTVFVRDDGKIYRKTNGEWQFIQQMDPSAFNEMDHRLSGQLAQTEKNIGNLDELTTESKESLVKALSENANFLINTVKCDGTTKADVDAAFDKVRSLTQKSILYLHDGLYSGNEFNVPSNCTIVFGDNAYFIPDAGPRGATLRVQGALPTLYTNVTADVKSGDDVIKLSSVEGLTPGDWVQIRSQRVMDGINSFNSKTCQFRKVEKVNAANSTITLVKAVMYNFAVSDQAEVGKAQMVENVKIIGFKVNKEGYQHLFWRGITLSLCANVQIDSPIMIGSRLIDGPDVSGAEGINMWHAQDVVVRNGKFNNIGWYGISMTGACENIRVYECMFEKNRHATSLNWQAGSDGYGEPFDVLIQDSNSYKSTLSAFDSHDVGRKLKYVNCKAYDSGDCGYQIRSDSENDLLYCEAWRSKYDGVKVNSMSGDSGGTGRRIARVNIIGGQYSDNLRAGISSDAYQTLLSMGVRMARNARGLEIMRAFVKDCYFTDNTDQILYGMLGKAPFRVASLIIDSCEFVKRGQQSLVISTIRFSDPADGFRNVRLIKNNFIGYADFENGTANILYTPNQNNGAIRPFMRDNRFGDNFHLQQGEVALVNGVATVSNEYILIDQVSSYRGIIPKIELTRLTPSGTRGVLYVDFVSKGRFTIRSTSTDDTSIVMWGVTY